MPAPPYFKFYWRDFAMDTAHLSPAAIGCYIRILNAMWSREGCRLPNDDRVLADICGDGRAWRYARKHIMPLLMLDPEGYMVQKRLLQERGKADEVIHRLRHYNEARSNKNNPLQGRLGLDPENARSKHYLGTTSGLSQPENKQNQRTSRTALPHIQNLRESPYRPSLPSGRVGRNGAALPEPDHTSLPPDLQPGFFDDPAKAQQAAEIATTTTEALTSPPEIEQGSTAMTDQPIAPAVPDRHRIEGHCQACNFPLNRNRTGQTFCANPSCERHGQAIGAEEHSRTTDLENPDTGARATDDSASEGE